jgi:hypothetical protein
MAVDAVVVVVMAQEGVAAEAAHIWVIMPPTQKVYAALLGTMCSTTDQEVQQIR